MIAGSASTMNIHCQPLKPEMPSRYSSMLDTGAPMTLEAGMAAMNQPTMRPR